MVNALLATAGVVLILVVVREVFHTLFHPSGRGKLTMGIFALVWAASGRFGDRGRSLAGPLAMVVAMSLWIAVTVLGWALVYLPALPEDFAVASGVDVSEDDLLDALYYSGVTQTTLGFGDITPERGLLRLLAPVQAALGFGLLTMVVTWVLSVYPALHRQRQAGSLAHVIRRAHERRGESLADIHPTAAARQLERLSTMLSEVRVDLTQYPSTFYFAAPGPTASLAEDLPFIDGLARAEDLDDEARAAAAELAVSIELFAATLATQHLDMPDADTGDVLRAFRRHHGLEDAAAPTGW